jgi:hypothetical protein
MAHTRPASFEVAGLTITPPEIDSGENVDISVLINNTGDLAGSCNVSLQIDDSVVQINQVSLAGTTNATVNFTVSPADGKHKVNVNGLSGTFTVRELSTIPTPTPIPVFVPPAEPEPARFTISDLSINTSVVRPGEPVTISTVVTNAGDSEGTYTAILKINGDEESRKEITVGAGKSDNVTFNITRNIEGSYTVNIDNTFGQFTVSVPETTLPKPTETLSPPPIYWASIAIIIVGSVIIGLTIYLLLRRKLRT